MSYEKKERNFRKVYRRMKRKRRKCEKNERKIHKIKKSCSQKRKITKNTYLPYPQDSKKFLQKGPNRPKRALGLCRKQTQIV